MEQLSSTTLEISVDAPPITLVDNSPSLVDWLTFAAVLAGWAFAIWLQRNDAKHQHKIQVRYDIYKEFLKVFQAAQNKSIKLGGKYAPFILIESSMINFDLKLKKEYKDTWIHYSEQECVFEGEQKWNNFVKSIFDDYFDFTDKYIEASFLFDGWMAAVEPLIETKKVLAKEINLLGNKILSKANNLQNHTIKNGHDWRKWNKKEIESLTDSINEDVSIIGCYLGDFMTLIHNELLSEYFGYKKPIRKTLDPNYKVLTKEGIVIRLEDNHEQKLKDIITASKNEII